MGALNRGTEQGILLLARLPFSSPFNGWRCFSKVWGAAADGGSQGVVTSACAMSASDACPRGAALVELRRSRPCWVLVDWSSSSVSAVSCLLQQLLTAPLSTNTT